MKLYIVRHGETQEILDGLVQGHLDGKLSKEGTEQAKKVGERLKNERFDFIYSSDLGRATQTLKEIIKYHPNIPVQYTKDLREATSGIFDGRPREEREKHRRKSKQKLYDYRPPKGESFHDVEVRIQKIIDELVEKHPDKNVLLVTHGRWIKILLGMIDEQYKTNNLRINFTSVSMIEIDKKKKHKIHTLNSFEHLLGNSENLLTD